ncbi:MAG TPA: VOC family protein [Kineosporiaceae bacterium]|nr:VOC family protein [Kineosporiaceae bacterium]
MTAIDNTETSTAAATGTGTGTIATTADETGRETPAPGVTSAPGVTPEPRVWPALRARDARALIDFLVEAFGFVEVCAFDDGHGGIAHAQLAWPAGGGIMLGSDTDRGEQDTWPVRPGSFGCYVVSDEVDEVLARATAAGATVVRPMNETDYGSREFMATDPEGNYWSFGTYRGEPVPRAGRAE